MPNDSDSEVGFSSALLSVLNFLDSGVFKVEVGYKWSRLFLKMGVRNRIYEVGRGFWGGWVPCSRRGSCHSSRSSIWWAVLFLLREKFWRNSRQREWFQNQVFCFSCPWGEPRKCSYHEEGKLIRFWLDYEIHFCLLSFFDPFPFYLCNFLLRVFYFAKNLIILIFYLNHIPLFIDFTQL